MEPGLRSASLLLVACAALVAACSSCPSPTEGASSFRSLARGEHSGVAQPGLRIVRDEDAWRALWREHAAPVLPTPDAPEVDFERELVAGVFLGERPTAGYGVEVVEARAADGGIELVARETRPPEDRLLAQVVTQPFHLVALPRPDGDVTLVWE